MRGAAVTLKIHSKCAFESLEDRALQCTLDMACICCKYNHNSEVLYIFSPLGRHLITMNMYRRYIFDKLSTSVVLL